MAAGRRRSTRSSKAEEPASEVPAAEKPATEGAGDEVDAEEENRCPACSEDGPKVEEVDKESWIQCDACKKWFHWRCVNKDSAHEPEKLDKWFCTPCMEADPKRAITVRPPARKSSRQKKPHDYANLHSGVEGGNGSRWMRLMQGKTIHKDSFKRMKGEEVGIEWLESDENAMKEPIVIETPDGLGMKMPPADFTVADVAEIIGKEMPVEVIDVATQSNSPGWTLGKWAEYYATEPDKRDKIRNVISLEISGTSLADQVLPPRIVRELDWVEKFWPSTKKGKGNQYPKVQLYCLMGVANAWTDWHVDFAGSSVYYHILRGAKVFYFIKPTPANLSAYERWSGTELQTHAWLGDMVDEVVKVELTAGNTMIIPTGWIHAVYTPEDTLVFGGNFLHSYNVSTQLKICEIEKSTHVPKKFRFPHFTRLCWYVAEKYIRDLKAKEEFHPRVMESIEVLANYLVSEVRAMERGSDQAKRAAKEAVPADRVKEPATLARELRWRVRLACGYASDEDSHGRRKHKPPAANGTTAEPTSNGAHHKRKREEASENVENNQRPLFKNFRPKSWDIEEENVGEPSVMAAKAPRPSDGYEWRESWRDWKAEWEENTSGLEQGQVRRRRDTVTRVRRTEKGLERQRIERTIEEWTWAEVDSKPTTEGEAVPMVIDQPKGDPIPSASEEGMAMATDS